MPGQPNNACIVAFAKQVFPVFTSPRGAAVLPWRRRAPPLRTPPLERRAAPAGGVPFALDNMGAAAARPDASCA